MVPRRRRPGKRDRGAAASAGGPRPPPRSTARSAFKFILVLLAIAGRHWSPVAVAAIPMAPAGSAGSEPLDEKSVAMAQRLLRKVKDEPNPPPSWKALLEAMEHSFLPKPNAHPDDGSDARRSTAHEEENARTAALHWLAHEDGSPSILSEEGYDLGLLGRYALATIYFATGGDDWSRCSRKKPSSDRPEDSVCESDDERYLSPQSHLKWDGINGKDGRVTWLDLSGRGLKSEAFLPLEATLLSPSLELFWVSENENLGGTLPEYLGEFHALQSLSVYKTSVAGTIPEGIYAIPKLNSLRLYKSKFEGTVSSDIGKLVDLKWLWIHDNDFTGRVPEEVGKLAKLEGITLHGNKFTPIADEDNGSGAKSNNIVPETLCNLKGKILKHLWTDCEEGSVIPASGEGGGGGSGKVALKEGVKACACCTRCFPRNDDVVVVVDE